LIEETGKKLPPDQTSLEGSQVASIFMRKLGVVQFRADLGNNLSIVK
jgi:hypothetical protein